MFATVHPDTHMRLLQGIDYDHAVFYAMTQLSTKAGIQKWGEPETEAVSTELEQIHYRDTFDPVNHRSLSKKEYEKVLESHLFLKQKRNKSIKGRLFAGGNKQRSNIDKEDATSPTAELESVLLTSTIDATEERDFAVIYIPNAFIHSRS